MTCAERAFRKIDPVLVVTYLPADPRERARADAENPVAFRHGRGGVSVGAYTGLTGTLFLLLS